MAQFLPLDACPKYLAMQVNQQAPKHDCSLTASPWQPTIGPYDLVRLHGTINERRVRVLIDDGSTHNFLNYTLVKKLRLPQDPSTHSYVVSYEWERQGCVGYGSVICFIIIAREYYET